MFQVVTPAADRTLEIPGRQGGRRALELVAMRGQDVLGVRHVLDGGRAWVGNVSESVARIATTEFGGHPLLVGEVTGGEYRVVVPARGRLRMHGADGLGRIARGPCAVSLHDGDKAVVVLGKVVVRACIVSIEAPQRRLRMPRGAGGWVALVGAVYVVTLTLCAALAPEPPSRLEKSLRRAVEAQLARPPAR